MGENFGRAYRLVINRNDETTVYTEQHIKFGIRKFAGGENNVAVIDVFNLPERERNRLARPIPSLDSVIVEPRITVFLYAGYRSTDLALVSRGVAKQAFTAKSDDGVNWRTHFETYSTLEQDVNTRIAYTCIDTPAREVLKSLFIQWKFPDVRITNEAAAILETILPDYVINGSVKNGIRRLLDTFNLMFTVDDDGPIVVVRGNAFDASDPETSLPLISEQTGMIGTPQITLTGVTVRAELSSQIANLYPLRSFVLESQTTRATFQRFSINAGAPENKFRQRYTVIEMDIVGDSREGDWGAAITGVYPNFARQGIDVAAQPREPIQ